MLLFFIVMGAYGYLSFSMAKTTAGAWAMFFSLIGITCVTFLFGGLLGLPLNLIVIAIIILFREGDAYKKNSKGYVPKAGDVSHSFGENLLRIGMVTTIGMVIVLLIVAVYIYVTYHS